jgi:hypothetical protein
MGSSTFLLCKTNFTGNISSRIVILHLHPLPATLRLRRRNAALKRLDFGAQSTATAASFKCAMICCFFTLTALSCSPMTVYYTFIRASSTT